MKWPGRRNTTRPDWAVAPDGARVLAAAPTRDAHTWLLGTRAALLALTQSGPAVTWPWEQIQAADWDADERSLRVSLIGSYGEQRPVAAYDLDDPDLLLQLLRERITASILYQRHVPVTHKHGFRVIGRRSPAGGETTWMCELDARLEPETPGLQQAMDAALARARDEVGA